ncbi:hypothetical protein FHJ31_01155 [Pseudomonas sp. Fig-3]|nr:hypothetical protein FHJ31_01155 [Pseudomonas sp. Fig-3]
MLAACSLQLAACSLQLAACSLQLAACSLQLAACSLQLAACSLQLQCPAVLENSWITTTPSTINAIPSIAGTSSFCP